MKKIIKREAKKPSQWAFAALAAIGGLAAYLPEAKAFLPPQVSLGVAVAAMVCNTIKGHLDDR